MCKEVVLAPSCSSIIKPQFISCQRLVLDRILHLLVDEELGANITSPNIEYPFVSQEMTNYDEL